MSAERYTTERSTLEKSKPEWGGALVGHHHHHQNAYFPRHQQQQNMKQSQHAYVHHPHHLVGGCLDDPTFQPDAGVSCSAAETAYGNPNSNINDCHGIQNACRFNPAANAHVDVVTHTAAPTASHQASQQHFSMPALESSTNDNINQKISVVAPKPRQARTSTGDQLASSGKGNVSTSTPRRMRNTSMAPLTVRPTGTKDRHSKVRTAKGLRDRRVRLSAPTAIQFFDVQDRLGYDQPSKAVDWLIKKARAAIDELAPVEGVIMGDELSVDAPARDVQKLSKDRDHIKVKDEEQSMTMPIATGCDARAESRAKARERARERAKEKCVPSSATATATASAPTSADITVTSASQMSAQPYAPSHSPNLHLLPEFFLLSSQVRQQIDGVHRPSNLSSMLTPPTSANPVPHLLPAFSTHLFPGLPISSSSSSFIYPGDAPPFQFSVPQIVYNSSSNNNNNNNTPISPRGTLQSIFSNPAKSSMHQAHLPMPPLMMMGALQAHAYGADVSPVGGSDREGGHVDNGNFRQSSAELGSPDLHHHSRIPMRIHGMELDAHVEENRMTTQSSMQADFH